MAVDFFLKFEDGPYEVKGEAQDAKHLDEIDVLEWKWGASNSGTTHMGAGSGAGRANFYDLTVKKLVDNSSPALMKAVAKGSHFGRVRLLCRKAGDHQNDYMQLEMKDCIITSVSVGGEGGQDRLSEEIMINFGEFKHSYWPQEATGEQGAEISFGYDIAAQEER